MTEVTLELMRQYLERFGWSRYQLADEPYEKEGLIRTGWRSSPEHEGYSLIIDPMVEKGCLSFKVPQLFQAPLESTPKDRLGDLCLAMSFINYRLMLGKFAYDPADGEVRFSVDVPIDKNTFTYEQFAHTLEFVIRAVEKHVPQLQRIVSGEESVQQLVEERTKEYDEARGAFADMLRQMLEALERERGGTGGKGGEGEGQETEGGDQDPPSKL